MSVWSSDVCSSDRAGWVVGADGVREKDGQRLEVALWTQGDTEFKRVTEAIQAQLKAIGMQAEITVFDSSTIRDQYKKNEHQLAVRSYNWNNADILDWFFSGQRLGYPNVSMRSEEHTSELQSLMRISYAVFCLTKKNPHQH